MPEAARPAGRANSAVDLDGAAARRVLPCVLAAQAEFVRVADRHLGDDPTRPSRLEGWTQAQLAAHVAYGAEALQRVTRAALRGVHEPFYPRPGDRDRSIERGRHLPTAVLRAELAASASALAETWLPLSEADWTRLLRDDRFPGATLARHLVLRWHEVEVHRHDFEDRTDWRHWSDEFVATALPLRLSWQPLARRLPSADQSVDGHWAFAVLGEPEAWVVTADGPAAHVSRSPRDAAQADASLEGPAAAVLAFLLGRAPADCLHIGGAKSHADEQADEVGIRVREDGIMRRTAPVAEIAEDDDLCVRAAHKLKTASGSRLGADLALRKVLPIGGGLGGGSSDAATVLLVLNRLWRTGLARSELMALAATLGADVPFFVYGENALGEGIGERLSALTLPSRWYVVLVPEASIGTASVFADKSLTRNTKALKIPPFFFGLGRNDLEALVARRHPEIAAHLEWLRARQAEARMTGSGACVFAEFAEEGDARRVLAELPEGMRGFVTRGLDRHPLHDWAN